MNGRSLHVAVIPASVRLPVSLVHLVGDQVDDLATLHWVHHPEQGWAIGHDPVMQLFVNVRATLLAQSAGETDFICGSAVLTGSGTDDLVDIAHDLITTLHLDRFG
jgi:hypothetical protein